MVYVCVVKTKNRLAVSMTGRRLSAAAWTNAITGGTGHFNVMVNVFGLVKNSGLVCGHCINLFFNDRNYTED
jgi:hypothetical protein